MSRLWVSSLSSNFAWNSCNRKGIPSFWITSRTFWRGLVDDRVLATADRWSANLASRQAYPEKSGMTRAWKRLQAWSRFMPFKAFANRSFSSSVRSSPFVASHDPLPELRRVRFRELADKRLKTGRVLTSGWSAGIHACDTTYRVRSSHSFPRPIRSSADPGNCGVHVAVPFHFLKESTFTQCNLTFRSSCRWHQNVHQHRRSAPNVTRALEIIYMLDRRTAYRQVVSPTCTLGVHVIAQDLVHVGEQHDAYYQSELSHLLPEGRKHGSGLRQAHACSVKPIKKMVKMAKTDKKKTPFSCSFKNCKVCSHQLSSTTFSS